MLRFSFNSNIRASNGGLCQSQGGIHPDRTIDHWVLIFVRKSCLSINVSGKFYDVSADQAMLLPPDTPHRGTRPYPEGLAFYWLHFHMDRSEGGQQVPLYSTLTRPHVMVELLRRFLDDQQSGRLQAMPIKGDLILLQMLAEIAGSHVDTSALPGASMALATRADEIVRSRYSQSISTSVIAADLGCHPDHLGRVYRDVFGHPLTEAINRHRVDRAALLLIEDSATVNEIAYNVGFTDAGYFRRVFKKYRAATPSEFRLLHTRVHLNT